MQIPNKQLKILSLFCLAVILVGCQPAAQSGPQTEAVGVTNVATATSWPVLTHTINTTPVDFQIVKKCVTYLPSSSANFMSTGSLLFEYHVSRNLMILEHASREPASLFDEIGFFQFSPYDGTMFWSNNNYDTSEFYAEFLTPEGERLSIALPRSLYFYGWLADGRIRLGVPKARRDNEKEDGSTVDEYYLLTPQTGELTYHSVNFPKRLSYYHDYVAYDPNNELVFMNNLVTAPGNAGIMSLGTEQFVWLTDHIIMGNRPEWKLDGSQAVYVAEGEIHSVARSGNSGTLTQFSLAIDEYYNISVQNPAFSPDGRYMRLKMYRDQNPENTFLYIYDTATNTVYDYCVKPVIDGSPNAWAWSPHSDQIAFVRADRTSILILNVLTGFAQSLVGSEGGIDSVNWVPWSMP
ncbi:MAG: hypothetical protein OEZ02_13225 [Anaerolineae bacterium]|nr:hypothetical protein [Anaerolineae bacterium]